MCWCTVIHPHRPQWPTLFRNVRWDFYRHSLSVTPETIICPSLSLLGSLCLSVCPAIKAYISVTMSWILMKVGESVGT